MIALAMSSYSSQTIYNKSRLKRFSHLRRYRLGVELLELKDKDRILDYGTGDGYFISQLLATGKDIFIAGYEPSYSMYNEIALKPKANLKLTNDLRDISSYKFNKIICLEVLEHLNNTNQRTAITIHSDLIYAA